MKYLVLPENKRVYGYCHGCGNDCGGQCGGNCGGNCGRNCGSNCSRQGGGCRANIVPIYAFKTK